MKKILFSIAILAVAFGFTACSNEDEALGNVKGEKTTVLAMTEVGTRTALESDGAGAYNVVWSEGDNIYIGNGHSEYKEFTLKSGAGETTATFEGEVPADGTYKVYYGSQYDTFESNQHYEASKASNFQMCASATVTDGKISPIQFWNVGGILRLTVKGTATIKNIKVTSEQPMSGPSSFNNETKTATASDYYNIRYVQLDCGDGVALTTEGTVFNIALLANTYTGVQITLIDADDNTLTKTFTGTDGLKIERSKITKASFTASFAAPTKGKAKANIGGSEVDVKWVQLWKDGPKFAEYNVGAASATEYGGHYAWGGSQDKVDDHNTTNTGEGNLTGTDDTATKLWGSNWRMPTSAELQALLDNCTCTWTENYNGTDINGLLCTGKGDYESNSVFLPAAGNYFDGDLCDQGRGGYYWSSTSGTKGAYTLNFESGNQDMYRCASNNIYSVRAVLNETPATTGVAKATIGGSQVDVNWVQLWKNGPKFAEYNIGASSVTETGTMMTFTDAVKEGDEYVWGANWCTPSKDEMEHLMTAAKGGTDEKVKCEYTQENSVWGFKFTGKADGYTDNSVFFPAQGGSSGYGAVGYWSATANDSKAWYAYLCCSNGHWLSNWSSGSQDGSCLVRPVLKN